MATNPEIGNVANYIVELLGGDCAPDTEDSYPVDRLHLIRATLGFVSDWARKEVKSCRLCGANIYLLEKGKEKVYVEGFLGEE